MRGLGNLPAKPRITEFANPTGRLRGESGPERAPLAGRPPAGLVDVERGGRADLRCKLGVGLFERLARALHDRVDRADREIGAEQLTHEPARVPARNTVPDRERRDCCLQARAKGAPRQLGRQLGARLGGAPGAAQTVEAVLGYRDRERWQLAELVALRGGRVEALCLAAATRA